MTDTKEIELLAPARNLQIGIAAINCGADAVYIGAERFGARAAAGNSLADIASLADYAHKYWAKVYVTINTVLFDHEIPSALKLILKLYEIGIDGLIIQDVGLLECDLPPIPLIASTQMHNNTLTRIQFLEQVGFQRVILARELSLDEIRQIRQQTKIELEFFIHGALCVCHSGQCYLSYAIGGRSSNRGQCAQPCRRSYSLIDSTGKTIVKDRYLLSLKDLNLSPHIEELIQAGICSFKIEGRLKDQYFVMNVVGYYRRLLDSLLPKLGLRQSSSGHVTLDFIPDPHKSFNRGFTTYFVNGRDDHMASINTPKSIGEPVGKAITVDQIFFTIDSDLSLNSGDGICFFDGHDKLRGTFINRVAGNKIYPDKMNAIKPGLMIYRNHDLAFLNQLKQNPAARKIAVELTFCENATGFMLLAVDEDGNRAEESIQVERAPAQNKKHALVIIRKQLTKFGGTEFFCTNLMIDLTEDYFMPVSVLNDLRRQVLEKMSLIRSQNRPKAEKSILPNEVLFPEKTLSYLGNVLNKKAAAFYQRHGVSEIMSAAESGIEMKDKKVMTTRYCLKHYLGLCQPEILSQNFTEPFFLVDENGQRYRLNFKCNECVMEVYF